MTVFLLILKIIGCVIAFLLLLLIAVCTIPVFYRASVDYEESCRAYVRLAFFFGLLTVAFSTEKAQKFRIRICGIPLRMKKNAKAPPKQKTAPEAKSKTPDTDAPDKAKTPDTDAVDQSDTPDAKAPGKAKKAKRGSDTAETKEPFRVRLGRWKDAVKEKFQKCKTAADKLRQLKAMLEEEETAAALRETKAHTLKILKHIRPRKSDLTLTVGLDDPADTGFLMAALSAVYPLYADWVKIDAVFDRKIIRIKGSVRGHMVNAYAAWHVLLTLRNQRIRDIINQNR